VDIGVNFFYIYAISVVLMLLSFLFFFPQLFKARFIINMMSLARKMDMLETFKIILKRFKEEGLMMGYEMLLEADACGWLFHLLLMQPGINKKEIHLDTRVCETRGRFDLVIGPINKTPMRGRPCVNPRFVVEVKLFPRIGFTGQQYKKRYERIINEDLPKLGKLDLPVSASLIIDGCRYLEGTYEGCNRYDYLVKIRNKIAPKAHIFMIHLIDDDNWRIDHKAPETDKKSSKYQ